MAQQSYLSTDPNAGEPVRESQGGYLSTDPNAGQPLRDAARSWRDSMPVTSAIIDAAHGAATVVPRVVFGGGDLIRRATGMERVIDRPAVQSAMTPPATIPGTVGQVAGQIGAFSLLPTAAGATLPVRVATQAAGAAGLTGAMGGTGSDAAVSGAISGAVPVVGAVAQPLMRKAGAMLRASADKSVSQALSPGPLRHKKIVEQVTPEILKRKTWAGTVEGLRDKADEALTALGTRYDDVNASISPATRIPTAEVRKPIREAMDGLLQYGSAGRAVPINPDKYKALQALDETIGSLGDKVSHQTLQAFKEEWAERVAKAGGFAEKVGDAAVTSEIWAKRQGADAIRRVLASDAPNKALLNAEYTFWSRVHQVADATASRTKPHRGFMRKLAGMAGAAAGFAKGGTLEAAGTAVAMSQAMRLMESTGWKLASAQAKNALANAMVSGNGDRIARAVGRVAASMPAQYRLAEEESMPND